jgi:F-type H+-transporting ATPase subunit a
MEISPDNIIFWQWQWLSLNATIVYTWLVMLVLVVGSWLITRNLSASPQMSRWQNALEMIVLQINDQIRGASRQEPGQYLPFVGTLFLFIAMANWLDIFPGYEPPVSSLSTTTALAICVFVAVPIYGIWHQGLLGYLKHYIAPTPIMLPFNIISELSRTLALAVRLFGNIMSTNLLVAIILTLIPIFFPAIMQAFGILVGTIQAYVFAILTMVYITSGMRVQRARHSENEQGAS